MAAAVVPVKMLTCPLGLLPVVAPENALTLPLAPRTPLTAPVYSIAGPLEPTAAEGTSAVLIAIAPDDDAALAPDRMLTLPPKALAAEPALT